MASHIILPIDSKAILLTRGMYTIIDEDDFEELSKIKWNAHKSHKGNRYYAVCNTFNEYQYRVQLSMHRVIMNAPKGRDVDHINGNGLDNRKCNLRICTRRENCRNAKKSMGKISKYKGLAFRRKRDTWEARISINNKLKYLGYFKKEVDAALAYNKAAIELFGEFARLNQIE